MIRPITLVCWILALSAGLYLYHAKHQVELIDQQIDQIAKQTADLRVESRGLLDQWIRLGEPEQLHKYSDEYLGLQPITPTQFARLSDLPARLPPPEAQPSDAQPDVAGPPTEGVPSSTASPGVVATDGASPDASAATDQASDQSSSSDSAMADQGPGNADGNTELPVPPIPPAVIPATRASTIAATTLPLQARPVTPRPADGQDEPDTVRLHNVPPVHDPDETRALATRLTPGTVIESHPAGPGPGNGLPGGQARGLPPLQAQGPRDVAGLPPLQAQGPAHELAQGPGRVPAAGQGQGPVRAPESMINQASAQPARPMDARGAEIREREGRMIDASPVQRQAVEPPHPPAMRETEQAQVARPQPTLMRPPSGGSLLGMSRGSVPLPLPAPTPVNADWAGPGNPGPLGPGR